MILELANNSQLLNTELGLDWIVLALRILNLVELKRKNAVSVELQTATILDWKIELKNMQDEGYDVDTIIDWLVNVSHLSNRMSEVEKTDLLKITKPAIENTEVAKEEIEMILSSVAEEKYQKYINEVLNTEIDVLANEVLSTEIIPVVTPTTTATSTKKTKKNNTVPQSVNLE